MLSKVNCRWGRMASNISSKEQSSSMTLNLYKSISSSFQWKFVRKLPGQDSGHRAAGLNYFHLTIEHQVEGKHLAKGVRGNKWLFKRKIIFETNLIELFEMNLLSQIKSQSSGGSLEAVSSGCVVLLLLSTGVVEAAEDVGALSVAAGGISRIRNCTWSYRSMSSLLFLSNRRHFFSLSLSVSLSLAVSAATSGSSRTLSSSPIEDVEWILDLAVIALGCGGCCSLPSSV